MGTFAKAERLDCFVPAMTPQELAVWSLRISVAAFAVSVLSFLNSWRLDRLQARKLKRELADDEAARKRAYEADIRVEVQKSPDRIVLHNSGAPALDVTLAFVGSDPIIASEHQKLPIPRMPHGATVPLDAAFSRDNAPPFDVIVHWTAGDGQPRESKHTVY